MSRACNRHIRAGAGRRCARPRRAAEAAGTADRLGGPAQALRGSGVARHRSPRAARSAGGAVAHDRATQAASTPALSRYRSATPENRILPARTGRGPIAATVRTGTGADAGEPGRRRRRAHARSGARGEHSGGHDRNRRRRSVRRAAGIPGRLRSSEGRTIRRRRGRVQAVHRRVSDGKLRRQCTVLARRDLLHHAPVCGIRPGVPAPRRAASEQPEAHARAPEDRVRP